jgi:adenosylhomocysteine nucleosidase
MSTLICFALKEEAAPFHKIAAGRPGVFTLLTGIGRQNAEKSVRSFLNSCAPELVLTCGFAGGLNPNLKTGDVVFEIGQQPSAIGNQPEPADGDSQQKLLAAGAQPVKFFCADRIATTVAEKKKLRDETGADAVEMESAAIHAVCRDRGLPCITLRAVSDPANEALPLDFNALAKPDQSLDFGKLAWAIAKSPGKVGALLALQKQTSLAARRLAAVLDQIISR